MRPAGRKAKSAIASLKALAQRARARLGSASATAFATRSQVSASTRSTGEPSAAVRRYFISQMCWERAGSGSGLRTQRGPGRSCEDRWDRDYKQTICSLFVRRQARSGNSLDHGKFHGMKLRMAGGQNRNTFQGLTQSAAIISDKYLILLAHGGPDGCPQLVRLLADRFAKRKKSRSQGLTSAPNRCPTDPLNPAPVGQ